MHPSPTIRGSVQVVVIVRNKVVASRLQWGFRFFLVTLDRFPTIRSCSVPNQAMCRSYRFGQQKPTFVYRLVAVGSLEHRVLKLQVSKELLSRRVVDDLDSHFERTCVTYTTPMNCWLRVYCFCIDFFPR